MRTMLFVLGGLLVLSLPLHADYLKNSDLTGGSSSWRGDGSAAFLKPDGTEGSEGDPGVIPVLRLHLSSQPHLISQEFSTRDKPASLHVSVDVFASSDFKRSKFDSDYSSYIRWKAGGIYYWGPDFVLPNVDFWIRCDPGSMYKLATLRPGAWTTVTGYFQNLDPNDDRVVNFCSPPGTGTIYIKNPSVTP